MVLILMGNQQAQWTNQDRAVASSHFKLCDLHGILFLTDSALLKGRVKDVKGYERTD